MPRHARSAPCARPNALNTVARKARSYNAMAQPIARKARSYNAMAQPIARKARSYNAMAQPVARKARSYKGEGALLRAPSGDGSGALQIEAFQKG